MSFLMTDTGTVMAALDAACGAELASKHVDLYDGYGRARTHEQEKVRRVLLRFLDELADDMTVGTVRQELVDMAPTDALDALNEQESD